MKRLAKILIVLLVVLVVSVPLWVDHAAKVAVEAGGTSALGVHTALEKISLGILGGTCRLEGLRIDNPEGYRTPFFLDLGKGDAEINLRSLMGDKIEVPTLTLEDVRVNLDRSGGAANYEVILENLKKLEGEPDPKDKKKRSFVIREVVLKRVVVHAQLSVAGILKPTVPLHIEEMRLRNVGEDGVPLSKAIGIIMGGLLRGIAEEGLGILPDEITGGLKLGVGALGTVGKLGFKVLGKGGKVVEGIGKGLGRLLGGGKDDQEEDK